MCEYSVFNDLQGWDESMPTNNPNETPLTVADRPRCCALAIATQDNPIFEGKELICGSCGQTWFYHNVGGWKLIPVPPAAELPCDTKLLPCPFCGSDAALDDSDLPDSFAIYCTNKKCSANDAQISIETWNTRALPPDARAVDGDAREVAQEITATVPPSADKMVATIADGLRHAIRDHGPITKEMIGSAAKRIWSRLQGTKHDPRRAAQPSTPIAQKENS